MNSITPLKNLVLIEIVTEDTRNGFVIPEQYKERNFGIVKAVGPGKKTKKNHVIPIPLKVGDKVLISDSGGRREIEIEGKPMWLIDADNLLGVFVEGEA